MSEREREISEIENRIGHRGVYPPYQHWCYESTNCNEAQFALTLHTGSKALNLQHLFTALWVMKWDRCGRKDLFPTLYTPLHYISYFHEEHGQPQEFSKQGTRPLDRYLNPRHPDIH